MRERAALFCLVQCAAYAEPRVGGQLLPHRVVAGADGNGGQRPCQRYLSLELSAGHDGRRRRIRRGGFPYPEGLDSSGSQLGCAAMPKRRALQVASARTPR